MRGTSDEHGPVQGRHHDRWPAVTVPILVMHGTGTEPWPITAATALAELLPTASLQAVQGQQHSATADVLAPGVAAVHPRPPGRVLYMIELRLRLLRPARVGATRAPDG